MHWLKIMVNPAPHPLLTQNLQFAPDYGNGMTSHVPMALHAMAELGASQADLHRLYEHNTTQLRRLPAAPAPQLWPVWANHLGDLAAYQRFEAHFSASIAQLGPDAVLADAVPRLWSGFGAVALHGVIRLAHAVEVDHPGELAAALAAWAAQYACLPKAQSGMRLPLESWVNKLLPLAQTWRSTAPLISLRMLEAAQTPAFAACRLDLSDVHRRRDLTPLARTCAALYAQTGNFTVLHLLTGTRALGILLPWAPKNWQDPVSAALTAAVLAAGLNTSQPINPASQTQSPPEPPTAPPKAPQILAMFSQANKQAGQPDQRPPLDEHAIKLTHACWQLAQQDDHEVFVQAAQRALK